MKGPQSAQEQFSFHNQPNIARLKECFTYHPDLKLADSPGVGSSYADEFKWMVEVSSKILTTFSEEFPLGSHRSRIEGAKKALEDSKPLFELGWYRGEIQKRAASALDEALPLVEEAHAKRKQRAAGATGFFRFMGVSKNDVLEYCLLQLDKNEATLLNDDSTPNSERFPACTTFCRRILTTFGQTFFVYKTPSQAFTTAIASLGPSQTPTEEQLREALELIAQFYERTQSIERASTTPLVGLEMGNLKIKQAMDKAQSLQKAAAQAAQEREEEEEAKVLQQLKENTPSATSLLDEVTATLSEAFAAATSAAAEAAASAVEAATSAVTAAFSPTPEEAQSRAQEEEQQAALVAVIAQADAAALQQQAQQAQQAELAREAHEQALTELDSRLTTVETEYDTFLRNWKLTALTVPSETRSSAHADTLSLDPLKQRAAHLSSRIRTLNSRIEGTKQHIDGKKTAILTVLATSVTDISTQLDNSIALYKKSAALHNARQLLLSPSSTQDQNRLLAGLITVRKTIDTYQTNRLLAFFFLCYQEQLKAELAVRQMVQEKIKTLTTDINSPRVQSFEIGLLTSKFEKQKQANAELAKMAASAALPTAPTP